MLVGIRPDDPALDQTTGATFHPQDEDGGGNVAYYEINATDDEIQIDLRSYIGAFDTPIAIFHTAFGETDFEIEDFATGDAFIVEQSGFDTDAWAVDLSGTSGRYVITQFDTDAGVDGTQAAWYPYVTLLPLSN